MRLSGELYSAFLTMLVYTAGCSLIMPPCETCMVEEHIVKAVAAPSKAILFKEPLTFYDSFASTEGVCFPSGIYELEAEDDEYYYFVAPGKIEYRIFRNSKVIDQQFLFGGLYMAKTIFSVTPAGAYYSATDVEKVHTWVLGAEFWVEKGRGWEKMF